MTNIKKSLSLNNVTKLSTKNNPIYMTPKSAVTINDLEQYEMISEQDNIVIIDKQKKVKFCKNVKVILIPSTNEYIEAQLKHVIWWNADDYKIFKMQAVEDIKEYLQIFPNVTIKEALSLLYQESKCIFNI